MSFSDLASLGSFMSGVAVLVSLVYLSLQIRQNTKHSQAVVQQGRAARIADTALRLAELRADDGINKCFEGSPDVTAKDLARFLFIGRAIFVSAEDSFMQNRQGLLDDLANASYEASLKGGMGSRGMGAAWLMTSDMYESEFRAYMNNRLGDIQTGANERTLNKWSDALRVLSGPA